MYIGLLQIFNFKEKIHPSYESHPFYLRLYNF